MSLDRRTAWIMTATAGLAFLVLAAVLVPWDWVPGGRVVPVRADEVFSAAQIARAEEYTSLTRWLGWASYAISLAVTLVLGLTPLGARLVRRLPWRRWWLLVPAAVLVLLLVGRVVTLPFSVLVQRRQLAYGLSEQPWSSWALDVLRGVVVSWALTTLALLLLLWVVRRWPRRWFLGAGLGAAALTVVGSYLYPVALAPVFNDFRPLPQGPLRSAVLELAADMDVDVDAVLVSDASRRTTTYNAYVAGLGSTRRVVLYDNLVERMPLPEARVIVAHELAHAEHRDVVVGTALGAVGAVAGVGLLALVLDSRRLRRTAGFEGPADPAVVPAVLALAAVATLLASPLQNAISRAVEARADREALAAVGETDTFVSMQRELAVSSLNDPTPPAWSQLWFGSHPTVLQRVGIARAVEEG